MLSVKKLSRFYGRFQAVKDVSFDIGTGEIIGLLGHNGAGKTTIMKMISGFLEADEGSIHIDGHSLSDNLLFSQKKIGYLPESLPVYPDMSVADYLDYTAELKGLTGDIKNQEIKRVVNATNLTEKFLAPIETLSRGYKQRVGVAQAVLGKPKLLILDEPTNGLDPEQTEQMRQLIRDVAQDATVILSTHIMQEVAALCSRVLIIRSGELVVDSALAELQQASAIDLVISHSTVKPLLLSVDGVVSVEDVRTQENRFHYRVNFAKDAELDQVSAQIAQVVVESGAQLFQLAPFVLDLEKLFQEVTQQSEANHAA